MAADALPAPITMVLPLGVVAGARVGTAPVELRPPRRQKVDAARRVDQAGRLGEGLNESWPWKPVVMQNIGSMRLYCLR